MLHLTIHGSSKTTILLISRSYFDFKICFSIIIYFLILKELKHNHLVNTHFLGTKLGTENIMRQQDFYPQVAEG